MRRVIIIGLDGVPYGLLRDFADSGVMPNVKSVIGAGTFVPMRSSIPEVSSVAWSSIITGANSGEHGIFGFTDFDFDSGELWFPNYSHLRKDPFWEGVPGSVIINVPSTYPVRSIDGVHISGFVSVDLDRSVWPKSLLPFLLDADYRLDVKAARAHSSTSEFLDDLYDTLCARIRVAEYLWAREWPLFMLVFTGTDRLMHFLWDAYANVDHPHHTEFIGHFQQIDEFIGFVLSGMRSEDMLLMLSDHGFEKLESEVYVNYILTQAGYLHFNGAPNELPERKLTMSDLFFTTRAYALDPGRIYVPPEIDSRKGILHSVKELFLSLEFDGRPVIKHIHESSDIYSGPYVYRGPDLVFEPASGLDLKASLNATSAFGSRIFTGKHTRENAFLLSNSPDIGLPSDPSVFDIADIVRSNLDG